MYNITLSSTLPVTSVSTSKSDWYYWYGLLSFTRLMMTFSVGRLLVLFGNWRKKDPAAKWWLFQHFKFYFYAIIPQVIPHMAQSNIWKIQYCSLLWQCDEAKKCTNSLLCCMVWFSYIHFFSLFVDRICLLLPVAEDSDYHP